MPPEMTSNTRRFLTWLEAWLDSLFQPFLHKDAGIDSRLLFRRIQFFDHPRSNLNDFLERAFVHNANQVVSAPAETRPSVGSLGLSAATDRT